MGDIRTLDDLGDRGGGVAAFAEQAHRLIEEPVARRG
jgi:hypothetical protein